MYCVSYASQGQEAPIISRVWDQLETMPVIPVQKQQPMQTSKSNSHSGSSFKRTTSSSVKIKASSDMQKSVSSASSTKRVSLRKLFRANSSTPAPTSGMSSSGGTDFVRDTVIRRQSMTSTSSSSSDSGNVGDVEEDCTTMLTDDFVSSIPTTELDLVNYIIAHGILREKLRSVASVHAQSTSKLHEVQTTAMSLSARYCTSWLYVYLLYTVEGDSDSVKLY